MDGIAEILDGNPRAVHFLAAGPERQELVGNVVSSRTRAAVRTATPTGVSFRGLGRHRLPGLPEAETLFQVRAKGLRGAFPKPRISARSRSPRRR